VAPCLLLAAVRGATIRGMTGVMPALLERTIDPDVARAVDAAPNRVNEFGFDPWGFSPSFAKIGYSFAKRVLLPYFRPEVHGIENVPTGRVLLVPNHSGQLPFDGIVIALVMILYGKPPRAIRAMVERALPAMPFVSEVLIRGGAVLGDPVNCKNLLEDDQAIVVFPEGARGGGKIFQKRYQLQHFGRGFMRLALQTNTPIVPVGVVGAEESILSVYDAKRLARLLGTPYFPVSPLLPLLGPFAYLPMPTKFHIRFGEPMRFEGPSDDEDSEIDKKVGLVKAAITGLLEEDLRTRKGIFR
jgi:1-acyl-sn-glycerol-3-phosphate acyltransferase